MSLRPAERRWIWLLGSLTVVLLAAAAGMLLYGWSVRAPKPPETIVHTEARHLEETPDAETPPPDDPDHLKDAVSPPSEGSAGAPPETADGRPPDNQGESQGESQEASPAAPAAPSTPPAEAVPAAPRTLRILHLGDSHTSADFFTGAIRKRLQEKFGDGGIGYMAIGRPHIGVRSDVAKFELSPGWTYDAIQKAHKVDSFFLSGFDVKTSKAGETIVMTPRAPARLDLVEIEAMAGPGGGKVEIHFDDILACTCTLAADKPTRLVFRSLPEGDGDLTIHKITIKTLDDAPVTISSIGVYERKAGVSYLSVGFPGATVDILNKFNKTTFRNDLRRMNPQIVVLAFGTNEGDREVLNRAHYREQYLSVLRRIKEALPAAQIIMVLPPDGQNLPRRCKDRAEAPCSGTVPAEGAKDACVWTPLPSLEEVREVQRAIAKDEGIPAWDWSSIMPKSCGAHAWFKATPHLMAPDHVHFTAEGYRRGADQFVDFLSPFVSQRLH